MNEHLDLIGIGALNFDYMFYCKNLEYINRAKPEFGQESLSSSVRETLEDEIDTLLYTTPHDIQFCGSSYFALKTVGAIYPNMKTSYVGVCGTPTSREIKAGFPTDVRDEFSFLYNKDWLFFDSQPPGIALIRLHKGTRSWIDINAGANSKLVTHIKEKENCIGKGSFVDFLANSKWIHLSSLADFDQFQYIVDEVKRAKEKNPWIKVSFDPGYEYTKKYRLQLGKIFGLADFVFLNENEVANLTGNCDLSRADKVNLLSSVFYNQTNNMNIIIIKGKQHHQIINFIDSIPHTKTLWHEVLKPYQIHNDTGAGDAFAGGFIAGILSNDLLTHQVAAIRLGAIAAKSRMTAKEAVFKKIQQETRKYIQKNQRNEQTNIHQRLLLRIENNKQFVVALLMAIFTGLLSSYIWNLFQTIKTP